jgi:Acidic N-terminal SPT6
MTDKFIAPEGEDEEDGLEASDEEGRKRKKRKKRRREREELDEEDYQLLEDNQVRVSNGLLEDFKLAQVKTNKEIRVASQAVPTPAPFSVSAKWTLHMACPS